MRLNPVIVAGPFVHDTHYVRVLVRVVSSETGRTVEHRPLLLGFLLNNPPTWRQIQDRVVEIMIENQSRYPDRYMADFAVVQTYTRADVAGRAATGNLQTVEWG